MKKLAAAPVLIRCSNPNSEQSLTITSLLRNRRQKSPSCLHERSALARASCRRTAGQPAATNLRVSVALKGVSALTDDPLHAEHGPRRCSMVRTAVDKVADELFTIVHNRAGSGDATLPNVYVKHGAPCRTRTCDLLVRSSDSDALPTATNDDKGHRPFPHAAQLERR